MKNNLLKEIKEQIELLNGDEILNGLTHMWYDGDGFMLMTSEKHPKVAPFESWVLVADFQDGKLIY